MLPRSPDESHPSSAGGLALDDAEFDLLRALIHELTGIALGRGKRDVLGRRLARRLRATGKDTLAAYCAWVRSLSPQADEVAELINCATTNTTGFFREPEHFEFLRTQLFPALELRARDGRERRVRLWSAACSSGEEPYSLAMTAAEYFAGADWKVEILATDVDTDVLARARAAVYPAERVESLPPETVRRHFLSGKGNFAGHYKLRPELAELVRFERLNFLDERWWVDARFDAILCRNVVIYFEPRTQEELFRRLHAHLAEDGYLIVGRSERVRALGELFEALPGSVHRRRASS